MQRIYIVLKEPKPKPAPAENRRSERTDRPDRGDRGDRGDQGDGARKPRKTDGSQRFNGIFDPYLQLCMSDILCKVTEEIKETVGIGDLQGKADHSLVRI